MTDDPFEACWYRWERADSRRQDMVKVWNDYVAREPHDIELVHQGQGVHVVRVIENEPMPADFAGLFGGWLYNLRAHSTTSSGPRLPTRPARCRRPGRGFSSTPSTTMRPRGSATSTGIRDLPEHQQRRLKEMQPFASDLDANFLGWINRLARIDRHRTLVDGACYLAELEPRLEDRGWQEGHPAMGQQGGAGASNGRSSRDHRAMGRRRHGEVQPSLGDRPGDRPVVCLSLLGVEALRRPGNDDADLRSG